MKNNKLFFSGVLITIITILGCSNDDSENMIEPIDNFLIESYHGIYAQYNILLVLNPDFDNLIKFEYDESNRIIKRIGDILHTSPNSGIQGYLHDSLYTSLTYSENKIHLEKKVSPFGGFSEVPDNETIIELDYNNRMIQKITFELYNDPQIDTTNYTYENGKLISFLKTSNRVTQGYDEEIRRFEESNLYYTNGNLDSIVTIYSYKPNFTDYTVLTGKMTKLFSDFDTTQNPFRKLQIFEETFNRSLSNNNFTDYREQGNTYYYPNNDFYQIPIMGPTNEGDFTTWNFAYDENGEWIYDQF